MFCKTILDKYYVLVEEKCINKQISFETFNPHSFFYCLTHFTCLSSFSFILKSFSVHAKTKSFETSFFHPLHITILIPSLLVLLSLYSPNRRLCWTYLWSITTGLTRSSALHFNSILSICRQFLLFIVILMSIFPLYYCYIDSNIY